MREIKFRIWDNLEKAYLNEEDVAIDEDLMARIKFVVDNLSFKIGDLTLMYEHKQVDPDDFRKEASCIKSDFVESIMDLIREHEESLEEK